MQPEIHMTDPPASAPASDLVPPGGKKGLPRITVFLGVGLLAAATFLAGIEAHKQWGGSSSSGGTGRFGAFPAANGGTRHGRHRYAGCPRRRRWLLRPPRRRLHDGHGEAGAGLDDLRHDHGRQHGEGDGPELGHDLEVGHGEGLGHPPRRHGDGDRHDEQRSRQGGHGPRRRPRRPGRLRPANGRPGRRKRPSAARALNA